MTRLTLLLLFPTLASAAPPNILWLCADDHAPYIMGAYGNKQARTPNLDRLAAQGIRFDRAYCNSPVCTASRQSLLTGRYPRTIGVTQLRTPLPDAETTLAEILKAAGYDTAAIGKMHFNSNLKHGFDLRIDRADHAAWLNKVGRTKNPPEVPVQPPWKPFVDPAGIWLNSAALPVGLIEPAMPAAFFADNAAEFLNAPRDKPFFLMASFYEPHSPFDFPVEYRDRRNPNEFTAPRLAPQDEWQVPTVFRDLTDAEKRGIIAAYHTSVQYMDANVGRVLAALDASKHAQDTIVIYTGDHGYMLGQHGRFEKHCGYEPAIRAPLLMRFSGQIKPQRSSTALVEFVDILPTVLEYAGIATPPAVQGRSFRPLIAGTRKTHRDRIFIEYAENEEAYIVTDRWKLIYCTGKRRRQDGYATARPTPGRVTQLFDLHNDPDELLNLAEKPEHHALVAELTKALVAHLKTTAREPQLTPRSDDDVLLLEHLLQPRDVQSS